MLKIKRKMSQIISTHLKKNSPVSELSFLTFYDKNYNRFEKSFKNDKNIENNYENGERFEKKKFLFSKIEQNSSNSSQNRLFWQFELFLEGKKYNHRSVRRKILFLHVFCQNWPFRTLHSREKVSRILKNNDDEHFSKKTCKKASKYFSTHISTHHAARTSHEMNCFKK